MLKHCRRETRNSSLNFMHKYGLKNDEDTTDCRELLTSTMSNVEHDVDYGKAAVLHCGKCYTVLSDTVEVCGEYKKLNSVICARVTKHVTIKEELGFQAQGPLTGCTYSALQCSGCFRCVGIILNSTTKHLSALRSLYLLQKENISCYSFKTSSMIKASDMTFEPGAIKNCLDELKQELDGILEHMVIIQRQLKGANFGQD
ncbi:protein Mis18-beta [Brienomyrus brachyistius]|uniref:protein Mis18-beta n=1 Tax=Brienomyrus brachyistius TaxID=42636 RepID=UPI0020B30AF2|nr:protein Mis18-beta [Brienomyrus brachyistius]